MSATPADDSAGAASSRSYPPSGLARNRATHVVVSAGWCFVVRTRFPDYSRAVMARDSRPESSTIAELAIADAETEAAVLPDAAEGHVEVWREQEQVCAYGYQSGGWDWLHVPRVATFRFLNSQPAVVAISHGASIDVIRDTFERTALPLALQAGGRQVLHASGVVSNRGVLAFCGASGTGKTTLAYAAARRGHALWADDAVAFDVSPEGATAIPLPFRMLVRADTLAFFGAASGEPDLARSPTRATTPLAAVVILERGEIGSGVAVRRLAGAEAFTAALAQAYCYRPTDRAQAARLVREYVELAVSTPILSVRFEPRFDSARWLANRIDSLVPDAA
jgi:hypothetical protein